MYMDAFGIRSELGDMAQRLASHGYVVALPNLYHRTPFAPFDPKQVAVEGPERARFKAMVASINRSMVMRDTDAVLTHLDTLPTVKRSPIGALGYCMGGGYALAAAGTFPDRVAVAASFHGGALATDKPDSPHLLAPKMRARVYVGAAGIDPTFPDEQRQRLEAALVEAGVASHHRDLRERQAWVCGKRASRVRQGSIGDGTGNGCCGCSRRHCTRHRSG